VPALVRKFDKRAPAVPPVHILAAAGEPAPIAAAKNGEADASEALVTRHQQRILAVALRYARVRQDAEDVMQQSFQKAFFHLRQFEGRSSFSTWLTRVAINEAQMLRRKSGGRREVSIDGLNENAETAIPLEIPDLAQILKPTTHSENGSESCFRQRMSCRGKHGGHSSCVSLTSDQRRKPPESWEFPLVR
jgi:RNA polymerase sigma factor (sigma-70 family)